MLRQLRYDFSMLLKRTPLIITCTLLVLYVFVITISSIYDKNNIPLQYYGSAYTANLIMSQISPFRFTSILLVFPLIMAVPVGTMMINERKSLTHIFVRQNKKVYILSKLFTSFIAGFIMMFITLAAIIIFGCIIFGEEQSYYNNMINIFSAFSVYSIKTSIRNYNLYFENPILYLVLYSLLTSIMMGIVSQLTMVIALFTKYKVIIYGGFFMASMTTVFIHPMIVPFSELLNPYKNVSIELINSQYFYPILFIIISIIFSIIFVRKDFIKNE